MRRSPPQMPMHGCPASPIAATSCLLSWPASTIMATSRVCESVTRSPLTNVVSQPSCFKVRLNAAPPPCTMISLCPSRHRSGMVLANLPTRSRSSSAAPPIFTTSFIAVPPSRRSRTSGSGSANPEYPVAPNTASCSEYSCLCKISADTLRQLSCRLRIGRDRQDSVIASDGPDGLLPFLSINGGRNRLRAAGTGLHHYQVLRRLHVVHELLNQALDGGQVDLGLLALGDFVALRGLHKPELVNVAGECGLRDPMAAPKQQAPEFLLAGHFAGGNHIANSGMA